MPTLSLTSKHIVMFSYAGAGVGVGVTASLKWTATSFDKTSGEKRCETSFEGGSKSDAEKLSHASFQRCTSAFEFSFAGGSALFYTLAVL